MITREQLEKEAAVYLAAAKATMMTTGHHIPTAIIVEEDNHHEIVVMPFTDDEERELTYAALQNELDRRQPAAVFLINDAKVGVRKAEDLPKIKRGEILADPASEDVLIVILVSPHVSELGAPLVWNTHYKKGECGRPFFEPTEFAEGNVVSSIVHPWWPTGRTGLPQ